MTHTLGHADTAFKLLTESRMEFTGDDVRILADDLATVHYEPHVDSWMMKDKDVEALFRSRIGGVYNLKNYMACIRPKVK
jgi:hypothetical protein